MAPYRVVLAGIVSLLAVSIEPGTNGLALAADTSEPPATITYVRKASTTNFLGWGQSGFYFPQFASDSIVGPKRTDDNMQFWVPDWLEFNFDCFDLEDTTFSADEPDCYDDCKGRGVYTRGGYDDWDAFILPNGFNGHSGSIVDEKADNNTNNTVNQIYLKAGVPDSFCMHLVTDNTANDHDSGGSIIVRGGRPNQGSFDPNVPIPGLSFDGVTDVHTFRFDNFVADDFIKIRLNSGTPGVDPGFGGIMFDESCDALPNENCGNNICELELGESCESCPGDCGACIPGATPGRTWLHHGTATQPHYVEGSNRLLIFIAHGVDDQSHRVEGVRYGTQQMHFLEGRSQKRNDRATLSVWYLKEAEIAAAGGTDFSVDWYHKPGQRSFESIFFTDVSQTQSFGTVDEAGCNDCYAIACPWETVEPGHTSLYAGTHERAAASFWPLNDFTQDADLWMGNNGRATLGHRDGDGSLESAGAQYGREGAFSLICFEVQDIPQNDQDRDGIGDPVDNCPTVQNSAEFRDAEGWAPQQDDDGDGIGNACDLVIPPQVLPSASSSSPYSYNLTALRGEWPWLWTLVDGSLPPGLSLSPYGVISGNAPGGTGTFSFTVQVMERSADTARREMIIQSNAPCCPGCHSE
jgi:hypothetical protein